MELGWRLSQLTAEGKKNPAHKPNPHGWAGSCINRAGGGGRGGEGVSLAALRSPGIPTVFAERNTGRAGR